MPLDSPEILKSDVIAEGDLRGPARQRSLGNPRPHSRERSKLLALLEPVRLGDRLDKRAVQKIGGSLLWAAVAVPEAKPWLADIYVAVSKPGQLWIQAQASCA